MKGWGRGEEDIEVTLQAISPSVCVYIYISYHHPNTYTSVPQIYRCLIRVQTESKLVPLNLTGPPLKYKYTALNSPSDQLVIYCFHSLIYLACYMPSTMRARKTKDTTSSLTEGTLVCVLGWWCQRGLLIILPHDKDNRSMHNLLFWTAMQQS